MANDNEQDKRSKNADWQRQWDVFHDALELPADQRAVFLESACGEDAALLKRVRKLLHAHQDEGSDAVPQLPDMIVGTDAVEPFVGPQAGDEFDDYVLEEVVGEGGMGVVFRARQSQPVTRKVALKVLQAGIATKEVLSRFAAERQALAIMNHTNIAKVYDAGTAPSGHPYFVMEYVDGSPVTTYCDDQRLTISDRLALFVKICDGVQHAHQKGVIHRDIKPSNVLVTLENDQPVPKIIDFGIAKATEQPVGDETAYTRVHSLMGTPGYMSPEQAGVVGLDVDLRADVYSLGVLLYVLLVGMSPFASLNTRRGLLEIQEAIRDEEAATPSHRLSSHPQDALERLSYERQQSIGSLRKQLDGDLSAIALKAMEKDRARRYSSVAGLMADVQRYTDGLPVEAQVPTRWYRVGKFIKRHRFGVAVASVVGLMTLVFAGFMAVQSFRLQAALDQAELERDRAEQVSTFMVQLFEGANPELSGDGTVPARDLLALGAEKLRDDLTNQPALRSRLLATVAETYRVMGGEDNAEEAESLLMEALNDLQALDDVPAREIARIYSSLGANYHDVGDYDRAEAHYTDAIDLFRSESSVDAGGLADALGNLGVLHTDRGNLAVAAELGAESLSYQLQVSEERSSEVARIKQRLAYVLYLQGGDDTALPMMLESLDVLREVYGDDHVYIATALNYTAIVQRGSGDALGAQASLLEAVDIYRATHGDDHPYIANTLSNLAIAYNQTNDRQLAIEALQEAMRIGEANYGPEHPNVNSFRINIGTSLQDIGRYADAEPYLREGLRQDRIDLDSNSPYLLASIDRLGKLLYDLGAHEEAEALLQEAVDKRLEFVGSEDPETGIATRRLAMNLAAQGHFERAEDYARQAITIHRLEGQQPMHLAGSLFALGQIDAMRGDSDGAAALFAEALALYEESPDDNALRIARVRLEQLRMVESTEDSATLEAAYVDIAEVMRANLDAAHPELAHLELAAARLDCRDGHIDAGVQALRKARDRMAASLGAENPQLGDIDIAISQCRASESVHTPNNPG